MGSQNSLPRDVVAALWRHGIEGCVVRVPPRESRGTGGRGREVLADLLARAEPVVLARQDAAPETVRTAWESVRSESRRYGVALDTMFQAMTSAVRDIGRWWSPGERRRTKALRRHPDSRASLEYSRARRHLAEGRDAPGVPLDILAMASASIAGAWWRRPEQGEVVARELLPEAIRLAFLRRESVDFARDLVVIAARYGLAPEQAELLAQDVEAGVLQAHGAEPATGRQRR